MVFIEEWRAIANRTREFDVLLTADKNLQHQQNIPKFAIGVVVLALVDTRLPSLRGKLHEIRTALAEVVAGTVIRIGA